MLEISNIKVNEHTHTYQKKEANTIKIGSKTNITLSKVLYYETEILNISTIALCNWMQKHR